MPIRPSKSEQDDFEGFARSALGKRKPIPKPAADATYVRKTTPADDAEKRFNRANAATHSSDSFGDEAKDHTSHDFWNTPTPVMGARVREAPQRVAELDEQAGRNVKNEEKPAKKAVRMRRQFPRDERGSP